MNELFFQFLTSPGGESYLKLREKLIQSDAYQPYSREIVEALDLFKRRQVDEACQVLQDAMPNLFLSPQAHEFLGMFFRERGDAKAAQAEFAIQAACIQGILSTGDGSAEKPYLVTRISDEYDVLISLEKKAAMQALMHHEGKHLDRIQCEDGSEYYFDVTDLRSGLD